MEKIDVNSAHRSLVSDIRGLFRVSRTQSVVGERDF